MQKSVPLILAFVFVWSSCSCKPEMVELMPPFTALPPEAYWEVPVIIVGLVLKGSKRIGQPHRTRYTGQLFTQRFRAVVQVENTLQGNISPGAVVNIYYFVDSRNLGSSVSKTYLPEGERDILLLEREYDNLRLVYDNFPNQCVFKVLSGAHPHFEKDPLQPWANILTNLLLTRGENVDDARMVKIVSTVAGERPFGDASTIDGLRRVAQVETPIVRQAACASLARYGQPCPHLLHAPVSAASAQPATMRQQ